MSFLDELEQDKGSKNNEKAEKTPRELWESSFKYFKHFVSILTKDKSTFEVDFNFIFLNLITKCIVSGPYEISRTQNENELKFELTLFTQVNKSIKIKRKDQRSAELLRVKLSKDNILSSVKTDKENNFFIEINSNIPSVFRIILKNEKDFFVEYKNLSLSTNRSIRLPIENLTQDYMDELAKYILGKNPDLYTESISEKEIKNIRDRISKDKALKAKREEKLKAILEQERIQEEIKKANTFKERSKRYMLQKSTILKDKITNKINEIKSNLKN